jgi:hypothetical protein
MRVRDCYIFPNNFDTASWDRWRLKPFNEKLYKGTATLELELLFRTRPLGSGPTCTYSVDVQSLSPFSGVFLSIPLFS